jgi:hypothetical protein
MILHELFVTFFLDLLLALQLADLTVESHQTHSIHLFDPHSLEVHILDLLSNLLQVTNSEK